MNIRRTAVLSALFLGNACGGSGLAISGMASVTIHQTGTADVSPDPWAPAEHTPVDAPPGTGTGVFGSCTHAGVTWTADINRAGVTTGLTAFHLVVDDLAATATIDVTVDGGSFSGSCSLAPNQWANGHDLHLAAECTSLTLGGDPRTVDANLTMTVENCGGS